MVTFPRVKAASYAIVKRLQGYHLLQNPKGTPRTEVNMLKTTDNFSIYFDDKFSYEKLTKNFANNAKEIKRTLTSTHYFDVDKKQMTKPRQKEIRLVVEEDGIQQARVVRKDMSLEEFDARKEPKLSNEPSNPFMLDSEYDKMCKQKQDETMNRRYYKTDYSLFQKIASFGLHRRAFYPQESRPNFFKVLYNNLTNKG